MKYSIKTEVYSEGLPFNKWFIFDSRKREKIKDLIKILGIDDEIIGLVIVNNKLITSNKVLEDRDSIKFLGRIYPEYL